MVATLAGWWLVVERLLMATSTPKHKEKKAAIPWEL